MKTVTFTVLPYNEFDELVAEHLGYALKRFSFEEPYPEGQKVWPGVAGDLESGNDSNHIFDLTPVVRSVRTPIYKTDALGNPTTTVDRYEELGETREYGWPAEIRQNEEWVNGPHGNPDEPWGWSGRTTYFLAKLMEKGIVPDEHPVMIQVSW